MAYKPHKTASWTGVMLGMRERLPLPGFAGGQPGANTRFAVRRADGSMDAVSAHEGALVVRNDEVFEFYLGSGGGLGDPLDREPAAVVRDLHQSRITRDEAATVYGVMLDEVQALPDLVATHARRNQLLHERLVKALPAPKSVTSQDMLVPAKRGCGRLLYPGVEHHDGIAYAVQTGVPLAVAPDEWHGGCPRLEERREGGIVLRSYLDPSNGRLLLVDATLEGEPCTVESGPRHWSCSSQT